MAERILRILLYSPPYAEDIRQRAEGVISGINAWFSGKVRIEQIAGADSASSTVCDAVVAILSPPPRS